MVYVTEADAESETEKMKEMKEIASFRGAGWGGGRTGQTWMLPE